MRNALRVVFPEAAEAPVVLGEWHDNAAPWHRASAVVDGRWVAKFAWSAEAADKVEREARVLVALGGGACGLLRRVVVSSVEPVLFVAPFVEGAPLTAETLSGCSAVARRSLAGDLASVLADLHDVSTAERVDAKSGWLAAPSPQATTDALRARLSPRLDPGRRERVAGWCDWVDVVLDAPVESVVLHGDFHGFNVVLGAEGRVRCVLDLEECAFGDYHFDFRYLPAEDPTLALFGDVVEAYQLSAGRRVSVARVMAWHVRSVLGDALWRTEAGVALPDGRTVDEWIDDLVERFQLLGIDPRPGRAVE